MTDKEIIQHLIQRNEMTTRWFFHTKCRPLFLSIMRYAFNYTINYDEFVNELYLLLMEDDARRLRQFDYRSTLCQWIKTVALRHAINKHSQMIEDVSKEHPYKTDEKHADDEDLSHIDIPLLLNQMRNRRYAHVLQRLVIEDAEPKMVAKELSVTVENLYNIKKRAITALTQMLLADIKQYKYGTNIR